MSDIIKFPNKDVINLVELGNMYDEVSEYAMLKNIPIYDIAGIMANRLGELVRIFDGDKEAFKGMLYNIIHDRAYLGESE